MIIIYLKKTCDCISGFGMLPVIRMIERMIMSVHKRSVFKKLMVGACFGAAAFCGSSFYLASYIAGGKRQTLSEALEWQTRHYDTRWYHSMKSTAYSVRSFDGYLLHVQFYRCPEESEKYIILTHGYTDNRLGNLKYMKMYLDLGYNCIIYDLRGHGENAPAPCTYSICESRDLSVLIQDTYERYGSGIRLGLHGESLGAATSAAVLRYEQRLDFVIADCGFSDILNVLQGAMRSGHFPVWLLGPASTAFRIRYGYTFGQMRPVDSLNHNHVPILFLHGADDRFIPPSNSERMAQASAGYTEVHLIPGAKHANSILTDPVLYEKYVRDFLEKC